MWNETETIISFQRFHIEGRPLDLCKFVPGWVAVPEQWYDKFFSNLRGIINPFFFYGICDIKLSCFEFMFSVNSFRNIGINKMKSWAAGSI